MTSTEADELARLLTSTWRGGPSSAIWADELTDLHIAQAQAAYQRLRRSDDHAPSIARFLHEYRALRVRPDTPADCPNCENGWTAAPTLTIGDDPHRRIYRQVQPCTCNAGQHAGRVHQTIREANRP